MLTAPGPAPGTKHRWHHQIFVFPSYVLALGALVDQTEHAHLALELAVALKGELSITMGQERRVGSQCLFLPGLPHRLHGNGRAAALWIDPALRWLRPGTCSAIEIELARHQRLMRALRALDRSEAPAEQAAAAIRLWASIQLDGSNEAPAADPRIARAMHLIHAETVPRMDRYDLARQVALSPSRFAALFAGEVGVSVRSYLIWRRMIHAVRCICRGASVTEAAREAGFADTPHFSRSYRQTFGSAPSLLLSSRLVISERDPATGPTAAAKRGGSGDERS